MLTRSGFDTTTLLYSSPTSLVYRAYWIPYQRPVVLKVRRGKGYTHKQMAQFQREYELIQLIS